MGFCQPESLRTCLLGHIILAAIFVGSFYLVFVRPGQEGKDITRRRAVIEEERPEILLIGNSLLRASVDSSELTQLAGLRTTAAYSDGSASLWWYLYVKNVATKTAHKPGYLGIMFRDAFLTEPTYRVYSVYQKPIRRLMTEDEPLVQELSYKSAGINHINSPLTWVPREARGWLNYKIEKRVEDLLGFNRGEGRPAFKRVFDEKNMVPGLYNQFQLGYEDPSSLASYDFDAQVERSYLPHIMRLLNDRGIRPIFIRAKRRRDLEPAAEPVELKNYIVQLRRYVAERGGLWIDFTHDDRIRLEHFGPGDHLSKTAGRQQFMRLLAQQLSPILAQPNRTALRR